MKVNFLNISKLFQSPLFLLKIVLLVIIALFIIFTIVVFTQVNVMNRVINHTTASAILKIIAILNIIFAISLFVTALVIL
jgi:small neutral amino acid transporter SnatA (MarC family)